MLCIGGRGFIGQRLSKMMPFQSLSRQTGFDIKCDPLPPLQSTDTVINLVGLLHDQPNNTMEQVQLDAVKRIVGFMKDIKCHYVHVSAIGSDPSSSIPYARTKGLCEQYLMEHYKEHTMILRPSIVFGPGDGFIQRFKRLSAYLPLLPVFSSAQFQPVHVDDLCQVIRKVTKHRKVGRMDVGGPDVYTYQELIELVLHKTNRKRLVMPLPLPLTRAMAYGLQYLPDEMDLKMTPDQLSMLQSDNVADNSTLLQFMKDHQWQGLDDLELVK